MSIKKEVTFHIFRFNRDTDYLPYYQTYKFEVGADEVVLDILNKIKWEHDGSFSYRRSCRHGICGSCSVKVNHKPTLACKDRVFDLIDIFGTNLTIDPQSQKRAVKDMIIDKGDFWEKYNSVTPYLVSEIDENPTQENLVTPHEYEMLQEADYCIQCGGCYYACPAVEVNDSYLGPAALALAMRFNKDVRDHGVEDRLRDDILLSILFDPQTSGGLLISLPDKEAEKLLKRLWERGIQDAQIVGQIIKTGEEKIIIEE